MSETKEYTHFTHRKCEFFPCHRGADPHSFNCLFCYCPLYALGGDCGGNFTYTASGVKDCSDCLLPHQPGGFDYIISSFPKISELAKKREGDGK